MGDTEAVIARVVSGIAEIGAETWDACAGAGNVFASYGFLSALEESGCVGEQAGWLPQHLMLEDAGGATLGVLPLYLKSHSYGEYVFDHAWAHALERAGGRYYPKLQCAVPFTPVTGPRLLAAPGTDQPAVRRALVQAAIEVARRMRVSSLHITFPERSEWELMGEMGLLQRTDQQFHWHNRGYGSFDDFLATLSSRKRKNIARERARAVPEDMVIETLSGAEISEAHWDAFFAFYMDTGARKWGRPYLTRDFFSLLGERLSERIVLIMCRRAGRYVAGALNLVGGDALYGRYWGCLEDHRFLHFEVCYYRAIDYAIAQGLVRVEAGAQGPHKLLRGYEPVLTYSAHWIADAGFAQAVARYLEDERRQVALEAQALARHTPFKKGG